VSLFQEHFRLTALRVLKEAPGYTTNSSIIHQVAGEFGIVLSRDQVMTELAWLAEQGLIESKTAGALVVATATARGLDAAEGRAFVPGVQRPAPGA